MLSAINIKKCNIVKKAVTEANNLLNRGDNPALIYLKGKISYYVKNGEAYVIFNIRQTIGFFKPPKRLTIWAFKKSLKKEGYFDKFSLFKVLNNNEFGELLEGVI